MAIVKDILIKVQKYEYMRRFLLFGEMYMNTLMCFTEMDESTGIGDKFENSISFMRYKPIQAVFKFSNGNEITLHPSGIKVREYVDQNIGNIYSMAMVDCDIQMIGENTRLSIIEHDIFQSLDSDYDTIVVILQCDTFIERCRDAFSKLGVDFCFDRVEYFSEQEYNNKIHITPFMKRDKYKAQNEFRLFADFKSNKPQIVNIGDIRDIAILVHKSGFNSIDLKELPESI
ncbi:hypothetical protein [Mediterranea massiliensis]|uniref:hypothetical protein n=1 Tax=Mediterranea massiliensis TaxID=1841865 RepID=UPI0023EF5C70|nr:hypothetical protein [Mediterranea massiliensis]